jgi:hypothetical protein
MAGRQAKAINARSQVIDVTTDPSISGDPPPAPITFLATEHSPLQGAAGAAAGTPAKLITLLPVLESGRSSADTGPEPDVTAVASGP